jgi:DNA-binding NarL/FixJ family response regulator
MEQLALSVVIADDHELVRDGLKTALEKKGDFKVIGQAANGKELVELVSILHPEIVVTDINMPVMNGVQATRIIKSLCPDIGIIAVSFMDNEFSVVEMLEAGALGYICKSSGVAELREAIWKVYSKIPYFCASTSALLGQRIAESSFDPYKKFKPIFTEQEIRVIRMIALGKNSREISELLDIKLRTVDAHRRNILENLAIKSPVGIMIYAIKNHIISVEEFPAVVSNEPGQHDHR